LSNSCQKVAKSCKKLTKGSAMHHWSFYVTRSSSKAFGISFADRPKAKKGKIQSKSEGIDLFC
jgi:hypothetical protein